MAWTAPSRERYLAWASGLVQGEFGYSRLFAQPVASLLGPALLSTLALAGSALLIALALGVGTRRARRLAAAHRAGVSMPSPSWARPCRPSGSASC